MSAERLPKVSTEVLLTLSQTNVTPDPVAGLVYAQLAYEQAETDIQRGVAARQAGFRSEQAALPHDEVETWFARSRAALAGDTPNAQRELIATELLTGRAYGLRIERQYRGEATPESSDLARRASEAFTRGETILENQHQLGQHWDRFGTMLTRHRATHEAMHGDAGFAARTALQGMWRAIRAKRESTPEDHYAFVAKQFSRNTLAGALAISRPLDTIQLARTWRHHLAINLLG